MVTCDDAIQMALSRFQNQGFPRLIRRLRKGDLTRGQGGGSLSDGGAGEDGGGRGWRGSVRMPTGRLERGGC